MAARSIQVHLFYSYDPQDESLRLELEAHLTLLRRQGLLSTWSEFSTLGGGQWRSESKAALARADIVLFLLSVAFVTSNECFVEQVTMAMARARAGECTVIPVLLRPVDWEHAPFGTFPVLPSSKTPVTLWSNRDEAWLNVVNGIRQAIDRLLIKRCLDHPLAQHAPALILTRGDGQAEVRVVFSADAELGRSAECDFAFRLANKRVSKRHARLLWLPGSSQFLLQDLLSPNGTYLDDEQLRASRPLRDGQRLALADALTFTCQLAQGDAPRSVALCYADAQGNELGRYVMAPEGAWRLAGLRLASPSPFELRHTNESGFCLVDSASSLRSDRLVDGLSISIGGQSLAVRIPS